METPNDEITLKELLLKTKEWFTFLLSKWKTIVLAGSIGAVLGLGYSFYKKPIYNLRTIKLKINNFYNYHSRLSTNEIRILKCFSLN